MIFVSYNLQFVGVRWLMYCSQILSRHIQRCMHQLTGKCRVFLYTLVHTLLIWSNMLNSRGKIQCVKTLTTVPHHLHTVGKIYPGSCTIYFCYETYRIQRKNLKIGKLFSFHIKRVHKCHQNFLNFCVDNCMLQEMFFSIGGNGIVIATLISSYSSFASIY